jgi:hypothetical protein
MDASEEEIEAEIQRQAERVGRSPEDVRRALGSRGSAPIRGDILRSKALAYLVEHADVRDVEREGGEAASETADGDQNASKE